MTKIKKGEHVFIAGRTGSGKTYLEKVYLAGQDDVIILDTKHTFDWEQIPDYHFYTSLEELQNNYEYGKAIYRPNIYEMDKESYNNFFKFIFERRNIHVGIDEVMSICTNASDIPFYYRSCLTMGRELGINVWSCTQRPKTIPQVILSESSHFFIFDLNLKADRDRVLEVVGIDEFGKLPSKAGGQEHCFYYYNYKMDSPILAKLS